MSILTDVLGAQVITDFTTCHNTWFHVNATRCFVPTEYCAMLARDNGLEDDQIIMHGGCMLGHMHAGATHAGGGVAGRSHAHT